MSSATQHGLNTYFPLNIVPGGQNGTKLWPATGSFKINHLIYLVLKKCQYYLFYDKNEISTSRPFFCLNTALGKKIIILGLVLEFSIMTCNLIVSVMNLAHYHRLFSLHLHNTEDFFI